MHGLACLAPRPTTVIINGGFAIHIFVANMQKSLIAVLFQQLHCLNDGIQEDIRTEFWRTGTVPEGCKDYRVPIVICASRERYMAETIERQLPSKQRRQQFVQDGILKL
jgi:hypothetical protein